MRRRGREEEEGKAQQKWRCRADVGGGDRQGRRVACPVWSGRVEPVCSTAWEATAGVAGDESRALGRSHQVRR
jgi:hypothetical protein